VPKLPWKKLDIKHSYKEEKVKKMYEDGRLLSFLDPTDPKSAGEMDVLRSWMRDFEDRDIPFIVVYIKKKLILLKERKA
jgi:hypothetical protein